MRRASAPMASHACLAKQTVRRRLSEGGSESVCLQSCSRMVDPNAVPHHRGVTRVCSIRSQHQMCVCARTSRGESASAMPCFPAARVASRRAMTRWASQPSVASSVARMAKEREASRRQVATTQAEGRQVTRQRHLRPSLQRQKRRHRSREARQRPRGTASSGDGAPAVAASRCLHQALHRGSRRRHQTEGCALRAARRARRPNHRQAGGGHLSPPCRNPWLWRCSANHPLPVVCLC